jgi:hypothetical protein
MPTQQHDNSVETGTDSTMQFRAPTLDEAIALAEQSLGSRVRVVAANRIRRGGIGGFFAADLGVEVTVAVDDETIEQALERLVAETAADERDQWHGRAAMPPVEPAELVDHLPTFATDTTSEYALDEPVAAPRADGPTMVRVEQIIEELQALTAKPLFGEDDVRPTPGRLRREAEERAAAQAAASAGAVDVEPSDDVVAEPCDEPAAEPAMHVEVVRQAVPGLRRMPASGRSTAAFPPSPGEIAKMASAAAAAKSQSFRLDLRTPTTLVAEAVPVEAVLVEAGPVESRPVAAEVIIDAVPAPRAASSSAPSRRQVDLAVAAADQLIESLKSDDTVKRLSVRVVLRTGDQREVEAHAEWEG